MLLAGSIPPGVMKTVTSCVAMVLAVHQSTDAAAVSALDKGLQVRWCSRSDRHNLQAA